MISFEYIVKRYVVFAFILFFLWQWIGVANTLAAGLVNIKEVEERLEEIWEKLAIARETLENLEQRLNKENTSKHPPDNEIEPLSNSEQIVKLEREAVFFRNLLQSNIYEKQKIKDAIDYRWFITNVESEVNMESATYNQLSDIYLQKYIKIIKDGALNFIDNKRKALGEETELLRAEEPKTNAEHLQKLQSLDSLGERDQNLLIKEKGLKETVALNDIKKILAELGVSPKDLHGDYGSQGDLERKLSKINQNIEKNHQIIADKDEDIRLLEEKQEAVDDLLHSIQLQKNKIEELRKSRFELEELLFQQPSNLSDVSPASSYSDLSSIAESDNEPEQQSELLNVFSTDSSSRIARRHSIASDRIISPHQHNLQRRISLDGHDFTNYDQGYDSDNSLTSKKELRNDDELQQSVTFYRPRSNSINSYDSDLFLGDISDNGDSMTKKFPNLRKELEEAGFSTSSVMLESPTESDMNISYENGGEVKQPIALSDAIINQLKDDESFQTAEVLEQPCFCKLVTRTKRSVALDSATIDAAVVVSDTAVVQEDLIPSGIEEPEKQFIVEEETIVKKVTDKQKMITDRVNDALENFNRKLVNTEIEEELDVIDRDQILVDPKMLKDELGAPDEAVIEEQVIAEAVNIPEEETAIVIPPKEIVEHQPVIEDLIVAEVFDMVGEQPATEVQVEEIVEHQPVIKDPIVEAGFDMVGEQRDTAVQVEKIVEHQTVIEESIIAEVDMPEKEMAIVIPPKEIVEHQPVIKDPIVEAGFDMVGEQPATEVQVEEIVEHQPVEDQLVIEEQVIAEVVDMPEKEMAIVIPPKEITPVIIEEVASIPIEESVKTQNEKDGDTETTQESMSSDTIKEEEINVVIDQSKNADPESLSIVSSAESPIVTSENHVNNEDNPYESGLLEVQSTEKPNIQTVNFDIDQNIAKYAAPIEFVYLDIISKALMNRNNILIHGFELNKPIAAGDNNYRIKKGGWLQFIGSINKQKGDILRFKNNQKGFVLGFDIQPMDKLIIGIAYANALSSTNFPTIFNDKQNTVLHMAAIYAQYTLLPNMYLNSYVKYGKAFIRNLRKRNNILTYNETKGNVARAKLETYYKFDLNKFWLSPMIGLSFDQFLIKDFIEHDRNFSISVPSRKGQKISFESGIGLSKCVLIKNFSIIPEIHLKLDRTLLLNNPAGLVHFTNGFQHAQAVIPTAKFNGLSQNNIVYTLGKYVNIQSVSAFTLGAGYDYSFKKDFTGHVFYINGLIKF